MTDESSSFVSSRAAARRACCAAHETEVVISIGEFIASGDIARYQELTGKKK